MELSVEETKGDLRPSEAISDVVKTISVARGGARAPPNQNTTNDKKLGQHSLAMFSCSFFSAITHTTVINNNINDNK